MRVIKEVIKEQTAYLLPIGDTHLEDVCFTKRSEAKLKGYINWLKENPNSRVFLNGDIFNVSTRVSKTSPHEKGEAFLEFVKNNDYYGALEYAVSLFEPVAHQIIGGVDGNHEFRMIDYGGVSLIRDLCARLSSKKREVIYCGASALLFIKVGRPHKRSKKQMTESPGTSGQTYTCFIHHTTGGGRTTGGKLNQVDKLRQIVAGCDVYVGNHGHTKVLGSPSIFMPSVSNCGVRQIRQVLVGCGSVLEYGGYAERGMYAPNDPGIPRIRFDGKKKDVHVSI